MPRPSLMGLSRHLRVAFLIDSLSVGGAERVCGILCDALRNEGVPCAIVTIGSGGGQMTHDLPVHALNLQYENSGQLRKFMATVRRVRAIRRKLKDVGADVLICFMPQASVLGWVAAASLGLKVVVCPRNAPWRRRQQLVWETMFRWTLKRADAVVCQNRPIANWVADVTGGRVSTVIPNPVELPIVRFSPTVLPTDFLNCEFRYAMVVGSKLYQKGLDLALNAVLQEPLSDWGLIIVGETDPKRLNGWCSEHMPELDIDLLEASGRLVRPGIVGNIEDWYRAADVFLLASRFEGQPNALIEALAVGTPSIAFRTDTGAEDFSDCTALTLLDQSEAGDMSDALRSYSRADAPKQRGSCSRTLELSPRHIARKWLDLLETLK